MVGRSRRAIGSSSEGSHSSHTASSFTDLMASLMVIFILLFVATLSNAVINRETTTEELLGALQKALKDVGGMNVGGIRRDDRDPYAVVVVMPEDLLFKRGDWNVGENGQRFLKTLIPALSQTVCAGALKGKVANVLVEGHTDTTWSMVGGDIDGPQLNLELSQKRSMDVVRWSLTALTSGAERDCFRRLLSASGRGQEELLPNIPGDDEQQRRVVFKIRTQQESVGELATELTKTVGNGVAPSGGR